MNTQIMPVTDLRRKTRDVIRGVYEDEMTVYITQHGRPTVVLVQYERYENMLVSLKKAEARAINLPTPEQKRAVALLQSWVDEGDDVEQRETGEALLAGLDANRPLERKHFPLELKGVSW